MIIECQHTVQDYLAAQRLHFRPRPNIRYFYWLLVGLMIAAVLGEAWTIFRGGVLPRGWWVLPAGLAYVAVVFFIFLPWRVGKIFRDSPALLQPIHTTLADDGFLLKTSRGQIRLPWALVKSWKRNNRMLLVYHSKIHFHLFPRRAFKSQKDYDYLIGALVKNVGMETV